MRFRHVESILRVLRNSVRGLLRNPAFACTAIFSLAMAIGASTAIFTAVDALLFKPLPVKDPGSLVTLAAPDAAGRVRRYFPLAFAKQLRASGVFTDIIATKSTGLSFTYGGRPEPIIGEVVTSNFFTTLGIAPTLGQEFTRNVVEGRWAPEVVLSYSFWKARFGGDASVLGRVIRLNTYPFTIVGVSGATFLDVHQGQNPEVRISVLPPGQDIREIDLGAAQEFGLIARLASKISSLQAQAEANSELQEYVRASADAGVRSRYGRLRLRLEPGDRGWPELAEDYGSPIMLLFLLVLTALLIACANVANMLLARAASRRREFAIRSSLGAGRGQLMRQILMESFVLSWCGGLAGLAVASWVAQFLLHFLPQGQIPLVLDLRLDARSLGCTFVLCNAAALLFGFTSGMQSTRGDLVTALKTDSDASIGSTSNLRKSLVAFQIAFSLALLVVGGLFMRTVFNLRPAREFPEAQRILTFTMRLEQEIYSPERVRLLVGELVQRTSSLAGVRAAGIAEYGPFTRRTHRDVVQVTGRDTVEVASDTVSPGFLDTVGLSILSGRDFTASDGPGAPDVVIVSQGLARELFPSEDAIGKMIQLPSARATVLHPLHGIPSLRIVGIVPDGHYYDVRRLTPSIFFTFQKDPPEMPTLYVRVRSSNPDVFVPMIRREFNTLDAGLATFQVRTLEARIQDALGRERMIADLSGTVGGLALILAAIGLYGVLAYSVARRTREIGIRIALGSQRGAVLWLICREALVVVGLGAAAGLTVAIIASSLVANRLYGVAPADPATLLIATALLAAIAVIAALVPALKASRVDPVRALRCE